MVRETTFNPPPRGAVIALGNFDGVHLGHRTVLAEARSLARAAGRPVLAASFDPHPVRFFDPHAEPFLLSRMERRSRLLIAAGVDRSVALPFDHDMAKLAPEEFVRHWLHDRLGASAVVTGRDFNFGRNRGGDVDDLRRICAGMGIRTAHVPIFSTGDHAVSSTAIREAIRSACFMEASELLGRPVELEGIVLGHVPGGLELDFGELLRPAPGSYAVSFRGPGLGHESAMLEVSAGRSSKLAFHRGSASDQADGIDPGDRISIEFLRDGVAAVRH